MMSGPIPFLLLFIAALTVMIPLRMIRHCKHCPNPWRRKERRIVHDPLTHKDYRTTFFVCDSPDCKVEEAVYREEVKSLPCGCASMTLTEA